MTCEKCFDLNRPASAPCPECGDVWEMPKPRKITGEVAGLLTNLAQFMDARKFEPDWTEWDQRQREHITQLLTEYHGGPNGARGEHRSRDGEPS